MNFFKTKTRTPPDLVRGLRDAINRLEAGAPGGDTRRKVRRIFALNLGLQCSECCRKSLSYV
jgi:calcium binding protein 39